MLKNVKLKRILKSTAFRLLSLVNAYIPKNDRKVMLYSGNMGIRHNLRPLKDYLIENDYHKKYIITCVVEDKKYCEDDGLCYITQLKGILDFFTTRHVFYTTGQIPIKPSKKQIVIHMDHGTTGIKTIGLLSRINNGDEFYFTYYCAPSELYQSIVCKEFNCGVDNIVINSEPVTDVFFQRPPKYDFGKYNKLGLWTPTFRQSDYLGYSDSEVEELLPTLTDDDYESFNKLLEREGIVLIVKLHDGQKLEKYKKKSFSNLIIMSGVEFENKGYNLYILLMQTDFIIADYSSVYLQYLLLNKPIGFAIPDIDDYSSKRGFVFDSIEDYMPGPKIRNKEDLFKFIQDMSSDKDDYKNEREIINKKINHYRDGKSCERLIAYSDMRR